MKNFTTRDLERFSGIKADTLRMWEKRYALLQPGRSKTNIRHYTLADLERLLSIALLYRNGYRISTLAQMPAAVIEKNIIRLSKDEERQQRAISALLLSMFGTDLGAFEAELNRAVAEWGIATTINKVIYCFLEKIEALAEHDRLDDYQLYLHAIRQKLILGIEQVPTPAAGSTALLFQPAGQRYDPVLLFINYRLKAYGFRVINPGAPVDPVALKELILSLKPAFLFTHLTRKGRFRPEELARFLEGAVPQAVLVLATFQQPSGPQPVAGNLFRLHPSTFLHPVLDAALLADALKKADFQRQ